MSSYIERDVDVNVEGVEFFVKDTPDGYAYTDKDFVNKASYKNLEHIFKMNDVVVIDHDKACRGIAMEKIDDDIVVSYLYPTIDNNSVVVTPKQIKSYEEYLVTDTNIAPDEDLLGKVVSDLQDSIEIAEDKITGTLKYVTGYTGFSSKVEEQSGNYLAIHNISNIGEPIFVEVINGFSGPVQLDADGIIILRIANNEQKVKVTCGDLVKEYSLSELTLQEA